MKFDSPTPTAPLRVNTEASTSKRLTETEFWALVERLEIQYGLRGENRHDTDKISQG